ncbi:hydroxymethylglutaryl-CoA reductase [Bacillus thuringiensis]|uniref:hydroxymethylglutaryl-CoA reductase n=1 Tax=Bacillus thuringiensis TaxID=1428 RepID=UPI000E4EF84F|nr:hydroxymethylglutaryl-CoA reductase [Bacillus thuringiensis]MDZ3952425.1 hydroxymethylglutaryl-CoA reductase [Bacillus thuringiensis]
MCRSLKELGFKQIDYYSTKKKQNIDTVPSTLSAPITRDKEELVENAESIWGILGVDECNKYLILDEITKKQANSYEKNIENFIGTIKVPVGLIGPLRINGIYAQGDYYLPLATTEGALVASYNRGSKVISESGGCNTLIVREAISRTPGFIFENVMESNQFVNWVVSQMDTFQEIGEKTTRYGKLIHVDAKIDGDYVILIFEYTTGDAAGQNMVTVATQAILEYIIKNSPIEPRHYFIETNLSNDKKASFKSLSNVRGKKVCADVTIKSHLVKEYLNTTPEKLMELWKIGLSGAAISGTIGTQAHVANGLAAFYLATGNDVACVSESSIGLSRLNLTETGDLYASITLPNIVIGSVGGGTGLPSQRAALNIIDSSDKISAHQLAEMCAALSLAGELSIAAAIAANQFTDAHQRLGR